MDLGVGEGRNGFIFIGMFSPCDPGYQRAKENLEEVEENTFFSAKRGSFVHYFAREEVTSLFAGFRVVHFVEGLGLDLDHDEPHYHGFIEYIGQKAG